MADSWTGVREKHKISQEGSLKKKKKRMGNVEGTHVLT